MVLGKEAQAASPSLGLRFLQHRWLGPAQALHPAVPHPPNSHSLTSELSSQVPPPRRVPHPPSSAHRAESALNFPAGEPLNRHNESYTIVTDGDSGPR